MTEHNCEKRREKRLAYAEYSCLSQEAEELALSIVDNPEVGGAVRDLAASVLALLHEPIPEDL